MRASGRTRVSLFASAVLAPVMGVGLAVAALPAVGGAAAGIGGVIPLAVRAPFVPGQDDWGPGTGGDACVTPAPVYHFQVFHCYAPNSFTSESGVIDPGIRDAYGVNSVAPLAMAEQGYTTNYGQGQTIVLVDSYGSPTAANDLQVFHDAFFPSLPNPHFQEIYPLGQPACTVYHGNGQSGCSGAAGWSGEATLDIEWAYSIAPLAHLVLIGVPPAETEGVQGFPNLFKAMAEQVAADPPGTVFSMSFGNTEQTFGGAAQTQTAKLDQVFEAGLAKGDNFFAATGDTGTLNSAKQHKETTNYPYPTVGWPATSPYVVAVGGTQMQYGWTWDPTDNTAFTSTGAYNAAYWNATAGGNTEAVWNESWAQIGTMGGASVIYPEPAWQSAAIGEPYGNHRLIPDTSWNAAVNGGVLVYISAYSSYNCPTLPSGATAPACWQVYGGTSAATPQTAALVALANAARAAQGKGPVGFLDPLLYGGIGAADYRDTVPVHQGSAPAIFAGTDLTPSGPVTVTKSAGDLVDNQMWEVPVAGYPTTPGWDATTGWGSPMAPQFVAALVSS